MEVELGRSAVPQYLVYSELRNLHPMNSDYKFTKDLDNYAAAKFVTRVREIVKNEIDPLQILEMSQCGSRS